VVVKVWTGFSWRRVRSSGRVLLTFWSHKRKEFLDKPNDCKCFKEKSYGVGACNLSRIPNEKRRTCASSLHIIVVSHTDATSDSAAIRNIHMRSSDCYRQFRNEERRSPRTRMAVTNTLSTVRNIRLVAPGSGLNLMLRNVFTDCMFCLY